MGLEITRRMLRLRRVVVVVGRRGRRGRGCRVMLVLACCGHAHTSERERER